MLQTTAYLCLVCIAGLFPIYILFKELCIIILHLNETKDSKKIH